MKAGGCCDRAGHCQNLTKTCDGLPVAVLNALPPAIHVAWSVETVVIAPQRNSFTPVVVRAHIFPRTFVYSTPCFASDFDERDRVKLAQDPMRHGVCVIFTFLFFLPVLPNPRN